MLQHMLLTMAAAPLIVIGSPIAVALRRTPPGARRALAGFGRGRAAHLITSPMLGWALLPAVQVVVYTTPLLGLSAQNDAVHAAVHAALLGAALLFWRPVLGADPIRRLAPLAQVGYLLAAMPASDVVGVWLVASAGVHYPATVTTGLGDQRAGRRDHAGRLVRAGSGGAVDAHGGG